MGRPKKTLFEKFMDYYNRTRVDYTQRARFDEALKNWLAKEELNPPVWNLNAFKVKLHRYAQKGKYF